jgi:ribonuclease BN (tRNA processing enzyme)
VTLDHLTPVLAYAYEPDSEIHVRKDRLAARGLVSGPWLATLKQKLLAGDEAATIALPDGSEAEVAALATELLLSIAGKRLVYATDLADTRDNRARLVQLAQHAHTLFCEATFTEADVEHARSNGHLTARACGEIAETAGVARLVPFHISRRYLDKPEQVYDELIAACGRVVVPRDMAVFESSEAGRVETLEIDPQDP